MRPTASSWLYDWFIVPPWQNVFSTLSFSGTEWTGGGYTIFCSLQVILTILIALWLWFGGQNPQSVPQETTAEVITAVEIGMAAEVASKFILCIFVGWWTHRLNVWSTANAAVELSHFYSQKIRQFFFQDSSIHEQVGAQSTVRRIWLEHPHTDRITICTAKKYSGNFLMIG